MYYLTKRNIEKKTKECNKLNKRIENLQAEIVKKNEIVFNLKVKSNSLSQEIRFYHNTF